MIKNDHEVFHPKRAPNWACTAGKPPPPPTTLTLLMCGVLAVVSACFCPVCFTKVWWLALYCGTLLLLLIARCYVCCVSAQIIAALCLTETETIIQHCFLAGPCQAAAAASYMVGSPMGRRVARHHCTASHFALRLIWALSPTREADARAESNRQCRDHRGRASAQLLRELKEFFGVPIRCRCRCGLNLRHNLSHQSGCCLQMKTNLRQSSNRWWW